MKSKKNSILMFLLCTSMALHPLAQAAHSAGNCPPLPPPTGQVVAVSSEAALRDSAFSTAPGTTIIVSQGVYNMQDYLHVTNHSITIRGATGKRGDVILDFGGMESGYFGILVDADDVTIADLTIRNARDHGVSIQGRDRPILYNLHIVDIGDQLVKVNPFGNGSEDGLLACSRLEYSTSAPDSYTNGISAHQAHSWIVRDNEWYRIRGNTDDPVPAILFWSGSSDTVVERNLLVDCSQGIAFGNASHSSNDHTGGIVRNNIIYSSLPHDVVIEMVHAAGWLVAHNTALLLNPTPGLTWGMEARFSDSQGTFAYNLTNMNIWHDRDGAQGALTGNVTNAQPGWFVDVDAADLHLVRTATNAIDKATALPVVVDDFDGDSRPQGQGYDIGADEHTGSAPSKAMPWIPLLLLGGEDAISMVTPYVDISDMASINEAFSSSDSAPWGFVHYGIDFFPNGNLKSFRAVSAGVVERVDKFLNEGNSNWQINVEVRLNATYSVGYAFEPMSSDEADGDTQLANILVIAGQKVKQGDIIGKLYTVGEGTHVDFGFYKNGVTICPEPYFTPEARDSILTLLHEVYPVANICY